MSELKPVLWFRQLFGAECHDDGCCYDIAFCAAEGYQPLYAIPADQVLLPRATLERYVTHLRTAGYNNAADDLHALLQSSRS